MTSRYDRQISIIGSDGQSKLKESTVAVIGCGGLGTVVMTNLASAGVGHLILVDSDCPDISNLNRQFIYREGQTENKAKIAEKWIKSLNPNIEVKSLDIRLNFDNMKELLDDADILVDCLDSVSSRRDLNKYAISSSKILVHGGVNGLYGQVTVVVPRKTACLDCILKSIEEYSDPPSLGAVVSFIASMEATEVIKLITGVGESLAGKLFVANMEQNAFEILDLKRDINCKICSDR